MSTFFGSKVSKYQRDMDKMDTGEGSVYFQNVTNITGIDFDTQQQKMRMYAIADPIAYLNLRTSIREKVLNEMIKENYTRVWRLLSEGITGDHNVDADQIKLPDGPWKPKMPANKINEVAMSLAMSINDVFSKYFEMILPTSYDTISERRLGSAADNKLNMAVANNLPNALPRPGPPAPAEGNA